MSITKIDTLCMSGGGDKAFAFIGCLDYLEKNYNFILSEINNYYGTSAGAIISFLFSIDYSIDEIKDFILIFDFKKLLTSISTDITNFLQKFGFDNCNIIMNIMKQFLKKKMNVDDITFIELFKKTGKNLNMIGTNFTKGTEVIFNYITSPNMTVMTALQISICIPLLFQPVLYNGDYYIDGGIKNNLPIKYCNIEKTLAIYIKFGHSNNLDSVFNILTGCISMACDTLTEKDLNNSLNAIKINNDNNNMIFDLTKENKINIIQNGYNTTELFVKNIPNKICKTIINQIISKIN